MKISIGITGITPLLMHRFGDDAALAATSSTRSSMSAADRGTPREQAEAFIYRSPDNVIALPSSNVLRSFVDGGKFHKVGKKQVTTNTESMMYACVAIDELDLPVIYTDDWSVDVRPVVVPATKGRILRYRPRFDVWSLNCTVDLDTSIMTPVLLRAVIDDAGKRVGLGDYRPARKGPFGRYRVDKYDIDV